jgi:RNA polymerase sigma-70 factor (ECF subfamily)
MVKISLIASIDLGTRSQQPSVNSFLKSIEKRAYKITEFAIHDRDEALDLVQNAMIKLVRSYSGHPESAWTLLFYRILQNEIRDWKRKAWVRGLFTFAEDQVDWVEDKGLRSHPDRLMEQDSLNQRIHSAIRRLPWRQQQAFLLRNFEGLDVQQTATAMTCSEGSVKTHYSRAVIFLREQLAGEDL